MTPAQVFDRCHWRYRECREMLDHRRSVINPFGSAKRSNRPSRRPLLSEYVADFELCGRRALYRRPMWRRSRWAVFKVFYCDGLPYKEAIAKVRCKQGTFDRWCWEVRRAVGAELLRAELFPTWRYFKERKL